MPSSLPAETRPWIRACGCCAIPKQLRTKTKRNCTVILSEIWLSFRHDSTGRTPTAVIGGIVLTGRRLSKLSKLLVRVLQPEKYHLHGIKVGTGMQRTV